MIPASYRGGQTRRAKYRADCTESHMTRVDLLSTYPAFMRAADYAREMAISLRTVRRQCESGTCDVQPAKCQPYRWRTIDVERHINAISLPEDRRAKRRSPRLAVAS